MTLVAFLASLAIVAGAPASATIVCNAAVADAGNLGQTYIGAQRIELAPKVCGGALLLLASPDERRAILRLNPTVYLPEWEGVAALAIAHESQHARGIRNEADAEACALQRFPTLLATRLAGAELDAAIAAGRRYDATLPVAYRGGTCA